MIFWTDFHGTKEELDSYLSLFSDSNGVLCEEASPNSWTVCIMKFEGDGLKRTTHTIYRDGTALTVQVVWNPIPKMGGNLLQIDSAVDPDGNSVELTQWESIQATDKARRGEDDTGVEI